jgi:hypothetical protein
VFSFVRGSIIKQVSPSYNEIILIIISFKMSNNTIVIRGTVIRLKDAGVLDQACVVLTSVADKLVVEERYTNAKGEFCIEISNAVFYTIQAHFKNFKSALFFIPKKVKSVYLDLHIYN